MTIEELIYRITGSTVVISLDLASEMGTTYNFMVSPEHRPVEHGVAKNAPKISYQEAFEKIIAMAQSDEALSSVVVDDMVSFFEHVLRGGSQLLDFDKIKNRELKVRLLAEHFAPEIDSDIVYNVLFYLVTGRTTYVRTFREFRRDVTGLDFEEKREDLFRFMSKNEVALTKYYRRNRSLLLFIKNNYFSTSDYIKPVAVRALINRISRNSRSLNVPTTNKTFSKVPYSEKPTAELLKMLYASDVVTVRNGTHYKVPNRSSEPYPRKEILSELRKRNDIYTKEQKALEEDGWTLALPSSAKRAAGIIPNGSSIAIAKGASFGVRWSADRGAGRNVDLDLSFTTATRRYGWNSSTQGDVIYSGDMTYMLPIDGQTQSAQELFTIVDPNVTGVLDISSYRYGTEGVKVELIIGDVAVPIEQPTGTTVLGYIRNNRFYVYVDSSEDVTGTINQSTITDVTSFNKLFIENVYML